MVWGWEVILWRAIGWGGVLWGWEVGKISVEDNNLKVVVCLVLGWGGVAVKVVIRRGFRVSGRNLLHVVSQGGDLACDIALIARVFRSTLYAISTRSRSSGV